MGENCQLGINKLFFKIDRNRTFKTFTNKTTKPETNAYLELKCWSI